MNVDPYAQVSFAEYSPEIKGRLVTALWLQLMRSSRSKLGEDDFFSPERDSILSKELIKHGQNQARIDFISEDLLAPISFQWIEEENFRQHEFINYQINRILANKKGGGASKYKAYLKIKITNGKNLCIANIDQLPMGNTDRKIFLEKLEATWKENISHDHLFDWYKKDTQRKIETTWKWFSRYEPGLTNEMTEIKNLDEVKMLFDKRSTIGAEKELCLKKIQRKLTQLKYTQGRKREKEALYIEISKEAKEILKTQSEKQDRSMSEIVEELIFKKFYSKFGF